MSKKFPIQVRIKEMSKQEEILLKRKREIERKMREKEQGGEMEKSKSENISKIPPKIPKIPDGPKIPVSSSPSVSSSSSSSNRPSGPVTGRKVGVPNKFHNDGSFLEQFKKLSKKEPDIKDEKPSTQNPVSSKSSQDLKQIKAEFDMEREECIGVDGVKTEAEPDWFLDALKRAQAKAKELQETNPTNPACPTHDHDDDASSSTSTNTIDGSKKRKSRWAHTATTGPATTPEKSPPPSTPPVAAATPIAPTPAVPSTPTNPLSLNVPVNLMCMIGEGEHMQAIQGVMVTRITRNNPAIVAYAHKVFGSLDLSEAQWRQCEDQMKMNVVYQLLQAKKREAERLEQQGKVKYEYDSDEETDGGTWEHKRRAMEMAETHAKATELTSQGEGKHHIGDFLPPDELARFMEKYRAIKEGRDPDLSDYQANKLTEENVGYRMLKSMGWTEGMGLGAEGKGITTPVNQNGRSESQGLGVDRPDSLAEEDDEYDAYRKRMMLAYRFRPNPLNNPRRAYY